MRNSKLLLALLLALAAATAAVGRRRGPWFCRGRSCPRFKTVRVWAGLGAVLEGLGRSSRPRRRRPRLPKPKPSAAAACSLPPLCSQLEDEGDYELRRYCRSTWAVSCACSDGEQLSCRRCAC